MWQGWQLAPLSSIKEVLSWLSLWAFRRELFSTFHWRRSLSSKSLKWIREKQLPWSWLICSWQFLSSFKRPNKPKQNRQNFERKCKQLNDLECLIYFISCKWISKYQEFNGFFQFWAITAWISSLFNASKILYRQFGQVWFTWIHSSKQSSWKICLQWISSIFLSSLKGNKQIGQSQSHISSV